MFPLTLGSAPAAMSASRWREREDTKSESDNESIGLTATTDAHGRRIMSEISDDDDDDGLGTAESPWAIAEEDVVKIPASSPRFRASSSLGKWPAQRSPGGKYTASPSLGPQSLRESLMRGVEPCLSDVMEETSRRGGTAGEEASRLESSYASAISHVEEFATSALVDTAINRLQFTLPSATETNSAADPTSAAVSPLWALEYPLSNGAGDHDEEEEHDPLHFSPLFQSSQ